MTQERFEYCQNMVYDILAVTELWRSQEKYTNRSNEFTTSATVRDKDGNLVNDKDPAAGVGILLSQRAQAKVLGTGNNGNERICWVRLKGPACNLFVVAVYLAKCQLSRHPRQFLSRDHVQITKDNSGLANTDTSALGLTMQKQSRPQSSSRTNPPTTDSE